MRPATGGGMRRRCPGMGPLGAVGAGVLPLLLAAGLAAQDEGSERAPTLPAGAPVVVLPVQSAAASPAGGWVGGVGGEGEAITRLDAELVFAFGEEAGARAWSLAPAVEARVARHPTLGVDPRRLAYQALLGDAERRQLPEPLHSQLRRVASLFDARLAVVPLAVSYRPVEPVGRTAGGRPLAAGRAALLLAVIDVRRSAVLWHGTIEGGVHEPGHPGALTTLALRVADQLAPS